VRAQLDDLQAELAEYEQLRSGTVRSFEGNTLAGLAGALVKARIAKGWGQGHSPRNSASPSNRSNATSRPDTHRPAYPALRRRHRPRRRGPRTHLPAGH
jgi:hypothetical protein